MRSRARRARRCTATLWVRLLAGMLVAGLFGGLSACTGSQSGPADAVPPALEDWVPLGPFFAPAAVSDGQKVPGPTNIYVPEVGEVRLDALSLLADGDASVWIGGVRQPDAVVSEGPGSDEPPSDVQIEEERYSYVFDGDRTLVAGIVRFRVPAEEDSANTPRPEQLVTATLGVDVSGGKARLLNRNHVFTGDASAGDPHLSSISGTSRSGVVNVYLEWSEGPDTRGGSDPESRALGTPVPRSRVVGVDVVRGTEVWFKEGGLPVFGEDRGLWVTGGGARTGAADDTAGAASGCRVEGIDIASGRVLWSAEGTEPADQHPDFPKLDALHPRDRGCRAGV